MPKYKVTTPRFHAGNLYGPETRRKFITVDKPYPKGETPDGLVLVAEVAVKKVEGQEVDRDQVKLAMLSMIGEKEGLNADGIPNMAPLQKKVKKKVGQALRDELMTEIKNDEQVKIEKDEMTFIEPGAGDGAVTTL